MADEEEEAIDVVVETPKGSRKKYEWDHERGAMRLDRRLFSATVYPADYGFIPEAIGGDGEELDALVLTDEPTFPGCLVAMKPVAVTWITYGDGEREAKIIGVPCHDPTWAAVNDLEDLPEHLIDELSHFFDVYKQLEPSRTPTVDGFDGAEAARRAISAGRERRRPGG